MKHEINEVPDINVGNMDTTTHDSIPAEIGENDEDRTSGDCISRQQAIDAFETAAKSGATIEDIKMILEKLPPAQPKLKKGKWIHNTPVTMKCDQCGLVIKDWDWHRFKFCPNCLADMRGEMNGKEIHY